MNRTGASVRSPLGPRMDAGPDTAGRGLVASCDRLTSIEEILDDLRATGTPAGV